MPLEIVVCAPCDECLGHQWLIGNESLLSELVAKFLMGQYRHVQKILANEKTIHITANSAASDLATMFFFPYTEYRIKFGKEDLCQPHQSSR